MRVPLELTFRDVEKTPAIERYIRDSVQKLERVCTELVSCRVVVEQPQRHQKAGRAFRVRVDARVPPGHELVVRREAGEGDLHETLREVLRDAFGAMRRQLQDLGQRQRGETKAHPSRDEASALVLRLFPEESYGFLRTLDGQEVYFHRNSVLHKEFDLLRVGTGVRCVAEPGDEGLRATTVEILDKAMPRPAAE